MPEVALHTKHLALGAKMGPFGGWDMPIEYTAGTIAEHTAVRTAVGIFDVSHMGKVRILGEGAYAFANSIFANDLDRIQPGQAQYSMLCNESGGIIDDLIVYLVSDTEVRFIPNAGNASTVVAELQKVLPAGLTLENNHLSKASLQCRDQSQLKLFVHLVYQLIMTTWHLPMQLGKVSNFQSVELDTPVSMAMKS
jgi:aminomethyltransferase